MEIKQVELSVECFKIDKYGLAYVFDLFEKVSKAIAVYDEFITLKVQFTNSCTLECRNEFVSVNIVGSWFDNFLSTLVLHYESVAFNHLKPYQL